MPKCSRRVRCEIFAPFAVKPFGLPAASNTREFSPQRARHGEAGAKNPQRTLPQVQRNGSAAQSEMRFDFLN